jgi:DNA-directed RNA polymerase beta subunit
MAEPKQELPGLVGLNDYDARRKLIFDYALEGVKTKFPVENTQVRLKVDNLAYDDDKNFTPMDQKEALLSGGSLGRKLKGNWVLEDLKTGEVLGRTSKKTIANIPWLTDRGTFIRNGSESSIVNQMRLVPGVFVKNTEDGRVETHVNVKPGTGHMFKVSMDPADPVFEVMVKGRKIKMYPLLKALGVQDADMEAAWGTEILDKNRKRDDTRSAVSAAQTFGAFRRINKTADEAPKPPAPEQPELGIEDVAAAFQKMELDPESVSSTLGKPYANVSPALLLDATKKMILLNRGMAEADDRDSLEFQRVHMAHDFIKERIVKDSGGMISKMLWKATAKRSPDAIPGGALDKHVDALFNSGGLTQYVEEINPLDPYDQAQRLTRLGEGALGDAVPDEARAVQPTFRGYVDPIRSPQSSAVGLDMRMAHGVKVGADGLLYREMVNAKTGAVEWVSSTKAARSVIGFPEALKSKDDYVPATVKAEGLQYVHKGTVDYVMRSPGDLFSTISNLVPMVSGTKGQRLLMGASYHLSALPLLHREAPLVRSALPDGSDSHKALAPYAGVVRASEPGFVESVGKESIKIKGNDGKVKEYPLYHNFPFARKSSMSNSASVEKGQAVKTGDLLATSNFSDKKGEVALGLNLRCAYMPYKGYLHEDAIVVSESAAKKLTSEMMTSVKMRDSEGVEPGLASHMSSFPSAFNEAQRQTIGPDGLVKVGTVVRPGDPLILAVKRQAPTVGSMGRRLTTDHAVTWDHHDAGVVTDSRKTKEGWRVQVRANSAAQPGDKLCYSDDTEMLTSRGWKRVSSIDTADYLASRTEAGELEYVQPMAIVDYEYEGPMHLVETTQVSLMVTPEHSHLAKRRGADAFELIPAAELFGTRYRLKKDAKWKGSSPEYVDMPAYTRKAGQGGAGELLVKGRRLSVDAYMFLLGAYLSEGNCFAYDGNYGIEITQITEPNRSDMLAKLRELGIKFNEVNNKTKVRLYGKDLALHFEQFGRSHEKFIPDWVFDCAKQDLETLYEWLMWVDGCRVSTSHSYCTTSERLAGDIQRLCLHIGLAGTLKRRDATVGEIKGKTYALRPRYDISIYRQKLEPEINHGHCKRQKGQREEWAAYSGRVYCPSLPRNHTVYVRRNGKTCWSGNCGRHGNKGVIGLILPDEQMPKDAQGRPLEVLLNPYGVSGRTNSAQMIEAALGKVAAKTGRPYVMPLFGDDPDGSLISFAKAELAKAGLRDKEDVFDPSLNKNLKDVFVGSLYMHKLQHTAEAKAGGRSFGGYTQDKLPSTGGHDGGKRIGSMECGAMFSHGAMENLKDMKLIKGQENYDYWRDVKLGRTPVMPRGSFLYDKFRAQMRSAGINLEDRGAKTHIFAMTNDQAKELTQGREVQNTDTYDAKKFTPIKGGMFDEALTGGAEGNLFAMVKLDEPVLNPIMEDSVRRILGVTIKDLEALASGDKPYKDMYGGKALKARLADVNLDMELLKARNAAKGSSGATRDAAVKKIRAIMSMKEHGVRPQDFMMDAVPVLPPSFRPITTMDGENKAADANYMYRELMFARNDLRDAAAILPDKDLTDARRKVIGSYKSLVGLQDTDNAELSDKKVGGILATVFGKSSPKVGQFHRRMIGMSQDLTTRAPIIPDPTLRVDQVGLPFNRAWELYEPFVVRRLVRGGMPATQAAKAVADRTGQAEAALQECVRERPVMINRAPTMHKHSIVGMWPLLVKGDSMKVPNGILAPMGADYDGNCADFNTELKLRLSKSALETFAGLGYIVGVDGTLTKETCMQTADTKVAIKAEGVVATTRIGEFPRAGVPGKDRNGADVYEVPAGVEVLTLDPATLNPIFSEVTTFTEEKDCPCVEVATDTQCVIVSDNESLCVFDHASGALSKMAPKSSVGMFSPSVRAMTTGEDKHSRDLGWWVGAFVSDGWVSGNYVGYAKSEKVKRDEFVRITRELVHDNFNSREHAASKGVDKLGDSVKLHLNGRELVDAVRGMGFVEDGPDRQALRKRIPPKMIFEGSDEFAWGLLSGLLDGDGTVAVNMHTGKPRYTLRFSTSSKSLVEGVRALCWRLGLRCCVSTTPPRGHSKEAYVVLPSVVDVRPHAGKLSCVGALERERVAGLAAATLRQDIRDYIPLTLDEAKNLKIRAKDLAEKAVVSALDKRKATPWLNRQYLARLIAGDFALEKAFEARMNPRIRWEHIERVTDAGRRDVYDFGVPGSKVFAVDKGLIIWDTLTIHVPVSDLAVKETVRKMMPNRMLLSGRDFKLTYKTGHEYVHGAWLATKPPKEGKAVEFDTAADAKAAFRDGKIDVDTPIRIRSRDIGGAR